MLLAGRMLDADEGAFGAVRVMVNTNQMGETAGVAAYLALSEGSAAAKVDPVNLRETMKSSGLFVL